ncbi:hypothetical protein [Nonomuraea sp. NEAU-A123]|uniref:hypothetical protein n=1 Tax=Nonomuraea sp. NEAU-A123 TaxID=2839649 RepID=UPI001BE41BD3|nr:hypothetical protein [Nonomuraea sp. NEAU-A123]MBT2235744.1 hypothetical protein [Nonomuraea sp. NEAU-A123]
MNVAYAYPWDIVGDPSAPSRLAELGVEAVALAASYHSTRAATPYHPAHRVLDVPYSAFYLPVRSSSWGRLTPASPTWTPTDAFLQARDALKAVGLQVHAWTVLTHNSFLGGVHPDLVVRNAFGDPYPYALCPAYEDVVEYCEHLVSEILAVGEPDGLILEACGPMGFGHQSVHEKTAGADWTSVHSDLLTLCFCTACAPRYPEGTRDRVRATIDGPPARAVTSPAETSFVPASASPAPTSPPSPATVEAALGPLADDVRAVRVDLSASLRTRLIAVARKTAPNVPITLHANPDPWAASSFAALPTGEPGADVLVGNCWGDPTSDAARLAKLGELCEPGQRVGAYVLALPPRPADGQALAEQLRTYAKAGATDFHLYHAGLASPHRLASMAEALRLIH